MGSLLRFLFIYVLGGVTFLPVLILGILIHAYITFPIRDDTAYTHQDADTIIRPGDDVEAIEHAQKSLGGKFQPQSSHEADVAAGYFAVCREYVPGGVNGKPPERNSPVGSATVSTPSPSVYQSMYRSLFERKPVASPLDNKGVGKPPKRGGNVFYVVLRHGHLMLFDDDEQLEVRHVVSLAHHHVSIYSGGDATPEGELFIKRNALCLSRRIDAGEVSAGGKASKPFFLFSENCSEKEDFYFALLRNQERRPEAKDNPPIPLHYEVKDIITLVQKLHSSEEHLQTRWINAFIGRIFLALYKTPEVENFIRTKITKKISRVKTPSFLSKISLQRIHMGEAAPVLTNPRLKDLTVDGELVVEANVRYSGNFRIEVAATARIELGTRFKAREVNLLLAVVVKRIEGHAMVRIKPPPSNRLWVTFSTMPKIDMTIEPIVSSRQITYTLILRQIENRIKEVVAESLVFPNWDDSPFYHSENNLWRGGIWADGRVPERTHNPQSAAAQDGDVDEVCHLDAEHEESAIALPQSDESISIPSMETSSPSSTFSRKNAKPGLETGKFKSTGSSSSIETRSTMSEKPRGFRSGSFASASSPIVGTDATNADAFKLATTPPDQSHAMAAISALSQTGSPVHSPVGSPSTPSRIDKAGSLSSTSSRNSVQSEKDPQNDPILESSVNMFDTATNPTSLSYPQSPASMSTASLQSKAPSSKPFGSSLFDSRRSATSTGTTSPAETKRISLANAALAATVTAKKWTLNAMQRQGSEASEGARSPSAPKVMGRGQPLPPPGVPLPPPDKKTKTAPIPVPKRKPIPPPAIPALHKDTENGPNGAKSERYPLPPPPLPNRRSREGAKSDKEGTDDSLLVVAAPAGDSEPTTPMSEHHSAYMPPWVDDTDETEQETERLASLTESKASPPQLPKRRPPHRMLSSSPEEDGPKLPSWMAAQEEEARAKTTFVDEDSGV